MQDNVWIVTALLAFAVTGCASIPTGRYQAFSAANENVQSVILDTDTRIEKRQRDFAVLTAPDDKVTASTFKPTIAGTSYDITSQLQSREAVLDVLVKYAKILESLAGKDLTSDVDRSALNLAASLNGLPASGDVNAIAKVFATLTDNLAGAITESKRKDALRTAMITAQPAVVTISKLLQRDYEKIAMFVKLMRDRYIAYANADRPQFGTWERYKFDSEVAAGLEEFQQINDALAAASAAIQKLPEAHQQLLEGLDNKETPLNALHDAIHETQRLRSFYHDLPSN